MAIEKISIGMVIANPDNARTSEFTHPEFTDEELEELSTCLSELDMELEEALDWLQREQERRSNAGWSKTDDALALIREGMDVERAIVEVGATSPNTKARIRKNAE